MINLILSVLGLTALQIVLGVDNVIFLSIVTSKFKPEFKKKARRIGIFISMAMNTILVLSAGLLSGMTSELFTVFDKGFNVHDLLMVIGGFFLVFKAVKELYENIEGRDEEQTEVKQKTMMSTIMAMTLIDFIFSIDSTITAIGMSDVRWIQLTATLSAILFMFFFFNPLNAFIEKHPSFKILALAFLVMIGFSLFIEGMGVSIPKGYVYSMMVFAILMEALNIRIHKKKKFVIDLHKMEEELKEKTMDQLSALLIANKTGEYGKLVEKVAWEKWGKGEEWEKKMEIINKLRDE